MEVPLDRPGRAAPRRVREAAGPGGRRRMRPKLRVPTAERRKREQGREGTWIWGRGWGSAGRPKGAPVSSSLPGSSLRLRCAPSSADLELLLATVTASPSSPPLHSHLPPPPFPLACLSSMISLRAAFLHLF